MKGIVTQAAEDRYKEPGARERPLLIHRQYCIKYK